MSSSGSRGVGEGQPSPARRPDLSSGTLRGRRVRDESDSPEHAGVPRPEGPADEQQPESNAADAAEVAPAIPPVRKRRASKAAESDDESGSASAATGAAGAAAAAAADTTESKRARTSGGETVQNLAEQIGRCFEIDVDTVRKHFTAYGEFETLTRLTGERLLKSQTLTQNEIRILNGLFNFEELRRESEAARSQPFEPSNPHPAFVINTLHSCMERMAATGGFDAAKTKSREAYQPENPMLRAYLGYSSAQQEGLKSNMRSMGEGGLAALRAIEDLEAALRQACVIDTSTYFPRSNNINRTYILRDTEGNNRWICKPTGTGENDLSIIAAEHAAHLINHHGEFPIPPTLRVRLDNDQDASVQLFIPNAKSTDSVRVATTPVNQQALQKLILFDMLFANEDRHADNFLFLEASGIATPFGIDHDQCMMFSSHSKMRFNHEYFIDLEDDSMFSDEVLNLVSAENVRRYAEIMRDCAARDSAIQWMESTAREIESLRERPIKEIFDAVEERYGTTT